MVANVPDSEPLVSPRNRTQRAYQLVDDPESAVTIARSGSRSDHSHATRIGLTGLAESIACFSIVSHHRATFFCTVSRQLRSSLRLSSGINALSAADASATMLTSVGYRIPIIAPSTSI